MSPYRRNVVVGLTVITGLLGLSVMLIKFGGTTVELMRRGSQVQVQFKSDRADGLTEGGQVFYRGVSVGRIISVHREANNVEVTIETLVAGDLPANVTGVIRTKSLVSGISAIDLELVGDADALPQGRLLDGQKLTAKFVGADLIPPKIMDELVSAGDLIKGLNSYVNDPKIRGDLQSSLQKMHSITDTLKHSVVNVDQFSDRLDKMGDEASATLTDVHATVTDARATVRTTQDEVARLTKQIDDRMLQLSVALENTQAITDKLNKGHGTAALLLNDPKLYDSLVDNSRELNVTIADLKRLVEQWEQEGVSFKMK